MQPLLHYSSVYSKFYVQHPRLWDWLEQSDAINNALDQEGYSNLFKQFYETQASSLSIIDALRRFRRLMSFRIAYKEFSDPNSLQHNFSEQSELAQFCINVVANEVLKETTKRYGTPWNASQNNSARFCILALGKLGSQELNFCSDVDLIYLYEGQGNCIKQDAEQGISNQEYFTHFFRRITQEIESHTQEGFLYNVDLRLRPDGPNGLIVRSFSAMENYYAYNGQTWERLALIKARPIVGDLKLGEALLQNLSYFRFVKSPLPSMFDEIGALKKRIQAENTKPDEIYWNIKCGIGGIREIEFIVLGLQMLHAAKNPTLQTTSFYHALNALCSLNLLSTSNKDKLLNAYNFFRLVENRLQIKHETPNSLLPFKEKAQLLELANVLGFSSEKKFVKKLRSHQNAIHALFNETYPVVDPEVILQEWIAFFEASQASPSIQKHLSLWFQNEDISNIATHLRGFLLGNNTGTVDRSLVENFLTLSQSFETVLPLLANPLKAIDRVGFFASAYGSRSFFLKTFNSNKSLFKALALAFDRSEFIFKIISNHPEAFDELVHDLPSALKPKAQYVCEIKSILDHKNFEPTLAAYVKLEEAKILLGRTLHNKTIEQVELELTTLADSLLTTLLHFLDPKHQISIVALGKYGGCELCPGSDLDIIFLCEEPSDQTSKIINTFSKILSHKTLTWPIYTLDNRLRPHGSNGPISISCAQYNLYLQDQAHLWEKQILTRARWITGNSTSRAQFEQILDKHCFSGQFPETFIDGILEMLKRIQSEKLDSSTDTLSFKHSSGGTQAIEFHLQIVQMSLASQYPTLKTTNITKLIDFLRNLPIFDKNDLDIILTNYQFLRKIEFHLRRDCCKSINTIQISTTLAKWLKFPNTDSFLQTYENSLQSTQTALSNLLNQLKSQPSLK